MQTMVLSADQDERAVEVITPKINIIGGNNARHKKETPPSAKKLKLQKVQPDNASNYDNYRMAVTFTKIKGEKEEVETSVSEIAVPRKKQNKTKWVYIRELYNTKTKKTRLDITTAPFSSRKRRLKPITYDSANVSAVIQSVAQMKPMVDAQTNTTDEDLFDFKDFALPNVLYPNMCVSSTELDRPTTDGDHLLPILFSEIDEFNPAKEETETMPAMTFEFHPAKDEAETSPVMTDLLRAPSDLAQPAPGGPSLAQVNPSTDSTLLPFLFDDRMINELCAAVQSEAYTDLLVTPPWGDLEPFPDLFDPILPAV